MTAPLTTSVVIPTWRRAPWLERCLVGLLAQSVLPDETIVVGRPDDVEGHAVVESRRAAGGKRIRWIEVDCPGHLAPVIQGLESATCDVVVFLDDDVVPQPGWLSALLSTFDDESIACVGGRVVTPGLRANLEADAGQIRWYGRYVGNIGMVDGLGPFEVASVMEGNWAWRRTKLASLEFDRRLDFDDASMYGLDLTLQARERGLRVLYQPTAVVVNTSAPRDPSLARGDRAARTFSYSRNYSLIASRHLRGLQLALFWTWWFLIGERGSYGLATGALDLASGRTSPAVVAAALKGKGAGARAWLAG